MMNLQDITDIDNPILDKDGGPRRIDLDDGLAYDKLRSMWQELLELLPSAERFEEIYEKYRSLADAVGRAKMAQLAILREISTGAVEIQSGKYVPYSEMGQLRGENK
jgi:hypothetical protein